jgi:hypothetical protein
MRIGLSHKRLDLKGGTERDLYVTAAGLRDLGHEVHLFCGEFAIAPPVGTFRAAEAGLIRYFWKSWRGKAAAHGISGKASAPTIEV